MKRYNGLHDKLCTIENIEVADDNARKNKNKKYGINKHDKNRQYENEDLVDKLFNLKYKTSKYSLYKIYEPKERIIYRLPYYPDRIAHHAIMNVVKDIWTKSFIHNREIDRKEFKVRMCAYYGWLKHADVKNLLCKIQSLTGVRYSNWNGKRTNITKYYDKYVRIIQVINYAKYFRINFKITKYDWRIYAKNRKEKVKPQT